MKKKIEIFIFVAVVNNAAFAVFVLVNVLVLNYIFQGFGKVGSHSAKYLCKAGMRLIGVIEKDGNIFNPRGINAEHLAEYMKVCTRFFQNKRCFSSFLKF